MSQRRKAVLTLRQLEKAEYRALRRLDNIKNEIIRIRQVKEALQKALVEPIPPPAVAVDK